MKNIIVPTDFSETAKNAYRYALDLATHNGYQLKVINVCHPGATVADGLKVVEDYEVLMDIQQKKLAHFVELEDEDKAGNLSTMVQTEIVNGFAHDELVELSRLPSTEMILMGTTGSSNILNRWFGSVSTTVAQDAECPVWLVPPQSKYKGIKKILYAGNYESANKEVMDKIIALSNQFNAEVQLLHVRESKGIDQEMEDAFLEDLFKKVAPSLEYVLHAAKLGTIEDTIYQWAEDLEADLIVLVNKKHHFWEGLFNKSTTKAMILQAQMPLLVLHD